MIKIGAFSRISQVPTKTLRYYDEIGLLTPAHIDRFTGYRYYEVDQIVRLNKILALKDLGFALEQIARLLDDDLSVEQMQGMLKLKRAEIESSLAEERARLTRVEARLKALTEGTMADYEVVLKDTEPIRVAAVRGIVPNYGSVGMLFEELFGELGRQGVALTGPTTALYYDEEFKPADVDIEVVAPIGEAECQGTERLCVRELPSVQVASLIMHGPYEGFTAAYEALTRWVETADMQTYGPFRETYLRGPGDPDADPADYVTDIQFPVMEG